MEVANFCAAMDTLIGQDVFSWMSIRYDGAAPCEEEQNTAHGKGERGTSNVRHDLHRVASTHVLVLAIAVTAQKSQ